MTTASAKARAQDILHQLWRQQDSSPERNARYFKTGPGDYAAHERFMGIKASTCRKIARQHQQLPLEVLLTLLSNPYNEVRLLVMMIMVGQYRSGKTTQKQLIFQQYLAHRAHINNWNLIDISAQWIIGAHLYPEEQPQLLYDLAHAPSLWDRRIAIIASFHYLKKSEAATTFWLCEVLLNDTEDLIHKACGWMPREVGKFDKPALLTFLAQHHKKLARVALRYAIEHFPEPERQAWLKR